MKFSDELWQQIAPTYQQIIRHPFNRELCLGTLERKRFDYYMEQDAYFLMGFSKAAAAIASRANRSHIIEHYLNFGLEMLVAERELHARFISAETNWDLIRPSSACQNYISHVIALATTGFLQEAIAASLPCPWIYREVGIQISQCAVKDNPYQDWIDLYASAEFSDSTTKSIELLDEVAEGASPEIRTRMRLAFQHSTDLELAFWNDSHSAILD